MASPRSSRALLGDFADLAKPRITALVLFTGAIGVWMAPGTLGPLRAALFLAATALLVASANTLNCWVERDTDARMLRTRSRPLPAGRLTPRAALLAGLAEAGVAALLLALSSNVTTLLLGALALVVYVAVYTPLKRHAWWAVIVGAVPGAIPPLMGWCAVTGALDLPGWFLFGVLFYWQLPHFIAISLYLKEDYGRGGLRVLPLACGDAAARRHLLAYTVLLVLHSLAALPLGLAGPAYLLVAAVLGLGFVGLAAVGLRRGAGVPWARRAFAYSLVYLPALIVALVLDAR
jgi:protoheme IX farnesyltransferase